MPGTVGEGSAGSPCVRETLIWAWAQKDTQPVMQTHHLFSSAMCLYWGPKRSGTQKWQKVLQRNVDYFPGFDAYVLEMFPRQWQYLGVTAVLGGHSRERCNSTARFLCRTSNLVTDSQQSFPALVEENYVGCPMLCSHDFRCSSLTVRIPPVTRSFCHLTVNI